MLYILFLVLTSCIYLCSGNCPSNLPSNSVHKVYNGKCLEFVLQEGSKNWDLAEANCVSKGGHLATVRDSAEQRFILSTLRDLKFLGKGVWIGLTDFGHENQFTWSSGEPLTFTHWEVGQPGSGHEIEDCVLLKYPTGYWSDELCREFVFSGEYDEWICEYKSASQPVHHVTHQPVTHPTTHYQGGGSCPISLPSDTIHKTYGHKCYEFNLNTGSRDWDNAQANCKGKGGNLVTIENSAEQNFIVSTLKSMNFLEHGIWIGLTDYLHEGRYTWASGKTLSFTNWAPGQPGTSHDIEDCVLLQMPGGLWSDEYCREFGFFGEYDHWICEYDLIPSAITNKPVTSTTTSVPSTTITVPTTSTSGSPTTRCPPFDCALDCGLNGYQYSTTECPLCLCNDK